MITVSVSFMLYLESSPDLRMGKKVISVQLEEGATFGDLLRDFESNFGSALAKEIYDPEKHSLKELVKALVNGVLSQNLDGDNTALHQGDNIVFVPLVMGG